MIMHISCMGISLPNILAITVMLTKKKGLFNVPLLNCLMFEIHADCFTSYLIFDNALPGRLELPTLRLTASHSNQLSYGGKLLMSARDSCGRRLFHSNTNNSFVWKSQHTTQHDIVPPRRIEDKKKVKKNAILIASKLWRYHPRPSRKCNAEQCTDFALYPMDMYSKNQWSTGSEHFIILLRTRRNTQQLFKTSREGTTCATGPLLHFTPLVGQCDGQRMAQHPPGRPP